MQFIMRFIVALWLRERDPVFRIVCERQPVRIRLQVQVAVAWPSERLIRNAVKKPTRGVTGPDIRIYINVYLSVGCGVLDPSQRFIVLRG